MHTIHHIDDNKERRQKAKITKINEIEYERLEMHSAYTQHSFYIYDHAIKELIKQTLFDQKLHFFIL